MYYNGTIIRLFPSQMVRVFGKIFCNSHENKTFLQNTDEMKEFIDSISSILIDKSYEAFRQTFESKPSS